MLSPTLIILKMRGGDMCGSCNLGRHLRRDKGRSQMENVPSTKSYRKRCAPQLGFFYANLNRSFFIGGLSK